MTNNLLDWLAAIRLENIGPQRIRRWLEHFHTLKNLFSATEHELQCIGLTAAEIFSIKNPDWQQAEKDFNWTKKNNCKLMTYQDESYPRLLKETTGAPLVLFVQGDTALISQAQLAIVGSRNPTATGAETAEQFAYYLAEAGLIITSGLASGIDAASHRGALNAKGKTIAVCGSGLQHIYPRSHKKLSEEIIHNGALVSEFPPNASAKSHYFPMRNRVISGLSLGVLVIEAALKSGSLITARFAAEQNREVFAVPGSIHNPLARGCHQLIRQGAKLVETAGDIVEELGTLKEVIRPRSPRFSKPLEQSDQALLEKIGYEITSLDAIIMRCGLTATELSSMLLSLELRGYVKVVPGGYLRNPD